MSELDVDLIGAVRAEIVKEAQDDVRVERVNATDDRELVKAKPERVREVDFRTIPLVITLVKLQVKVTMRID